MLICTIESPFLINILNNLMLLALAKRSNSLINILNNRMLLTLAKRSKSLAQACTVH